MFNKKFIYVGLLLMILGIIGASFISADQPIIVKILDVKNVGDNLEVDASFFNQDGSPYTGNIALKSTAPPGFQPSAQSWGYTNEGYFNFTILNRQISDYDSITIFTEPCEQNNDTYFEDWISSLDNTTVDQAITNNSDGGVDVNVNISGISNDTTDIPIVVNTNNSESNNSSNINVPIVNGTGSIVVPIDNSNLDNGTSIQVIINGKSNGNFKDGFTGYKSSKSKPYIHIINNHLNSNSVGLLKTGNYIPGILVILMILVIIVTVSKRKD
jgi:hypothetical protein